MQTEGRILRNTAVLGIGEAIGQVAGFAFVIMCGRLYGAGGLGWYSLGMAIGAIAMVFVSLGTHALLLRELAQRPEESARRIGGTLPYEVGLAILVWLAVVGATIVLVADPAGRWIIGAVAAYHLALGLAALRLVPSRARQVMWPSAVVAAAKRLLIVLCVVPLALLGVPASVAFLAFPVIGLLMLAAVLVAANRLLRDPIQWRPNGLGEQRALYSAGLPFFSVAAVTVLHGRLGIFIIAAMLAEESVGIYAAADRILAVLGVFQLLFVSALFPAVASLASTDRPRALEVAGRCMRLLLVLSIPTAGLLAILHREIILSMFGEAFAESAAVLLLLAPAFVVKGINALWTSQATAIGLQSTVARLRLFTLVVFAVLGVAATGIAGPAGLAVAILLAELVYAAALRGYLVRTRFLAAVAPVAWKPVAAVLAGTAAYMLLEGLTLPLRAVVVAAVIVAVLFALGAVRAHDLRYIRSVFSPRLGS